MHARVSLLVCCALFAFASASEAAATYVLDGAQSSLKFTFTQAGAKNAGKFKDFAARLMLPESASSAASLDVSVSIASLDTQDSERDEVLRGDEFFAVKRFPTARFVAAQLNGVGADRFEAIGRLTIRDVTRNVRIPFTFRRMSDGSARMDGEFAIKRLEFGVGQGDWRVTDLVANEVTLTFSLWLVQARGMSSGRSLASAATPQLLAAHE